MTNIIDYLNSLDSHTVVINISNRGLTKLPDLSRFTWLATLYCNNNQLTSLPPLNDNLNKLDCSNNKLTSLPALNDNLIILDCSHNQLV